MLPARILGGGEEVKEGGRRSEGGGERIEKGEKRRGGGQLVLAEETLCSPISSFGASKAQLQD